MSGGYDGRIKIDSKVDTKGFNRGVKSMGSSLKGLIRTVGLLAAGGALIAFGKSAVDTASRMASAMVGLQSVVEGTGGSFAGATDFIQEYISSGLVPLEDAITAYKNLAMRGYNTDQIEQTLIALRDAASFGRQASLTLGRAVSSATEGLKNENSILVDNAGVTRNVSLMWRDYAQSIGTTVGALTQAQKIQAEVNGILHETRFQTGDAQKLTQTYAGKVSALSVAFYNLKVAVGNAFIPVLSRIIPVIQQVVNWFVVLFNIIGRVMNILFQTEVGMVSLEDSSEGVADGTGDAADSAGDLADATGDAEDAAKGALAAFDEINVLNQDTADTSGGGGTPTEPTLIETPIETELPEELETVFDELALKVAEVKERILEALQPVLTSLENLKIALEPLRDFVFWGLLDFYYLFLKPVGEWVLGEGLPRFIDGLTVLAESIDWTKINQGLFNLWTSLEPFAINVGEGLLWFWENVMVPFGAWVMNDAVPAFLDLLSAAIDVLNSVLEALEPLGQWLYDEFLVPIGEWAGDAVISLIESLTVVLTGLSDWIDNNQDTVLLMTQILLGFLAAWKVDQLIGTVAAFVTQVWATTSAFIANTVATAANTTAKIASKLETIAIAALYAGDFLKNLLLSAGRIAGETIAWLANTTAKIAQEIAQIALNIAVGAWNIIGGIAAGVTTAFGAAMAFLTSPIGLVIIAIIAIIGIIYLLVKNWDKVKETAEKVWAKIVEIWGVVSEWFKDNVVDPVVEWFKGAWEDIGEFFSGAWDTIKGVWTTVATWFQENVIDPIATAWETFTDGLAEGWNGFWEGARDVLRGIINAIIGFINGLITGVVNGINSIISALNAISIDIPDWVPVFGGETWGVHINPIVAPQIPELASGAVIPPNSRFLAVLGDQRNGRNIEAPESLLRQIVQEEIGQIQTEVKLEFGGTLGALVRELDPIITRERTRVGKSLATMGAV